MQSDVIPIDLLKSGADELGVDISDTALSHLSPYVSLLLEWNRKFNLTRITDPSEIAIKHLIDSLTCFKAVEFSKGAKVIDIGTGAGLPGLVLKIVRPDLDMTLLDATRKKLGFLEAVVRDLELENVMLVHARAEDAAHDPHMRECFDIVLARAVSDLRVLCEYTIPYARADGFVIAQKGPDVKDELAAAGKAITLLGGTVEKVERLLLPGSDLVRNLVVIRKARPTPARYPRRQADINKKPL